MIQFAICRKQKKDIDMALPVLNIPELPAGINIPVAEMIHPMLTHFAIALPVVIIVLEIINLVVKKRTIGVLSFVFMLILTAVIYFALLSGSADAKRAGDLVSGEAKDILEAHKQLSIYLFYASLALMLFKLLSVLVQKTALKVLFLLVAIAFTAGIFASGKKGCTLVFQHAINVKSASSSVKSDSSAPPAQSKAVPQAQKISDSENIPEKKTSTHETARSKSESSAADLNKTVSTKKSEVAAVPESAATTAQTESEANKSSDNSEKRDSNASSVESESVSSPSSQKP